MKKSIKIVAIVLAAAIGISAIAGTLIFAFTRFSNQNFAVLEQQMSDQNKVIFKDSVKINTDSDKLQKKLKKSELKDGIYTLSYSKKLPEFFKSLQKDDIFCVYPDANSDNQLFALGFCGKVIESDEKSISYTSPELTEVFSTFHITTENSKAATASFKPADGVTVNTASVGMPIAGAKKVTNGSIGSLKYRYVSPSTQSKLQDYMLLNDELTLKFKHTVDCIDGLELGVDGKVVLKDTAVKFLMDYTYDETNETATVNDYSIGFITNQTVDLNFNAKGSIGLDDISFDPYDLIPMPSLDIGDATSYEDGKIVLGTFLIGVQANLPVIGEMLETHNQVSVLSIGIAIQLSVTATGELSVSCNINESGFAQLEMNSDGQNTCILKGYNYPNPAVNTTTPTEEQQNSIPNLSCSAKGDVTFDVAVGIDVGICILGMVPIKQSTNIIEVELGKTLFDLKEKKDESEIMLNNYLVNDNIDYIIVSCNSSTVMYLGAEITYGPLTVYDFGHLGGKITYYHNIFFQTPPPTGFTKEQTGFGGVFVGEEYAGDKLNTTFNEYMKDTEQDSFFNKIKDATVGTAVNTALETLNFDPEEFIEALGGNFDMENYDITYLSAGAIYIRDGNTVVASVILGDQIGNKAGIHNGLSNNKIKQVYSAPYTSAEVDLSIGEMLAQLIGIEAIDNVNLSTDIYISSDNNHEMLLLYADGELKIIVVTGSNSDKSEK
jgi:hypothetical protein